MVVLVCIEDTSISGNTGKKRRTPRETSIRVKPANTHIVVLVCVVKDNANARCRLEDRFGSLAAVTQQVRLRPGNKVPEIRLHDDRTVKDL